MAENPDLQQKMVDICMQGADEYSEQLVNACHQYFLAIDVSRELNSKLHTNSLGTVTPSNVELGNILTTRLDVTHKEIYLRKVLNEYLTDKKRRVEKFKSDTNKL